MNSRTEENYLKTLLYLSNKDSAISTNDISKLLQIKMPTVTGMMKKFADKGWVNYQSYKPIYLTPEGRKQAALVVRKHRLTEMFLVKIMGFAWDEVHEIAEQVEHIKSKAFFDKMDEILDHPSIDPHGAPIPDRNGEIPKINAKALAICREGECVQVQSVRDSSEEFLRFLDEIGVHLGKKIQVTKRHNFDQSMVILIDEKAHTFSKAVTEMIFVTEK
ncbi:metal-dependent transcriptional regulator [Ornithobacterium rhinotracheale]|uniref:Transcriptional regulator MntR n=1 Tax=Ornithobacterium rhinotracheale TaxID=28251 RepID=A0A410JPL3_ORNRH|nr:metal-dependent transcriptional regulator [Ornithobacterium rhinotracheale]QAR30090.1 metal-dependent transcriptional regulator [Ornithobacterium rhinotracheale]